jgi:hypothetical protein
VYTFLRPSLRAAVVYVIGALTVFGAVLAVLDARWNGLALEQVPGFALAPPARRSSRAGSSRCEARRGVAGLRGLRAGR